MFLGWASHLRPALKMFKFLGSISGHGLLGTDIEASFRNASALTKASIESDCVSNVHHIR